MKQQINKEHLWVAESKSAVVDTKTAILVGGDEGAARPHVDNRQLCRYDAVLYLSENPQPHSGTSFYRLKYAMVLRVVIWLMHRITIWLTR
ncbi:hypothetical protein [Thalassotalea fusca]